MKRALLVVLFATFGITSVMAGGHSCCSSTAAECKTKKDGVSSSSCVAKNGKEECAMHGAKQMKVDPKIGMCPVSGEPATAKVSYLYEGTTYHFCCKDCVKDFKANPSKFGAKSKS